MYRTQTQGGNAARMTTGVLLGAMLALGLALLVLLGGAAAVSSGLLGEERAAQITVVACVLGCFAGGSFTCRNWTARRLLAGLATGVVCFLLILTAGMLLGDGLELGSQGMIELAACLCGGGTAGLLCRKKRRGKGKRTARRSG